MVWIVMTPFIAVGIIMGLSLPVFACLQLSNKRTAMFLRPYSLKTNVVQGKKPDEEEAGKAAQSEGIETESDEKKLIPDDEGATAAIEGEKKNTSVPV
jgi:hypothetical protein